MSPEESVYELDNSDEESIPKLEKLVRDGGKEGGRECYSRKPPFLSKGSPYLCPLSRTAERITN